MSVTAEQNPWTAFGQVDIGNPLSNLEWDEITSEALQLREQANRWGFTETAARRDGSFESQSWCASSPGGDALHAVLRSRDLLQHVCALTGIRRLVPVQCGYLYYEKGDHHGIHRDSIKSSVTVTFGVTNNIAPMRWAPQLRTAPNAELAELVSRNGIFPEGFDELPVQHRFLRGFDGYNIPHWRPPFEEAFGILGTLCYFDL